jgi:hypothetical protein
LKRIYEDIELARQLGINGRKKVKNEYSLSVTVPKWQQIIKDLVE